MSGDRAVRAGWWRHGAAPLRGLVLALLGVVGLLLFVPVALAALVRATGVVLAARRLPELRRRLATEWSTVDIPSPYPAEPPAPVPQQDGLYRHGMRLYKSAGYVRHRQRAEQLVHDPATWRDLGWLLLDAVVGVPLALLPAGLIGGGLLAAATGPWWAAGLGLLAALAGITSGPWLLWVHGRWTRLLLGPARPRPADRPAARVKMLGAGVVLSTMAGYGLLLAVTQVLVLLITVPAGLVPVYPQVVGFGRKLANLNRRLAGAVSGVDIPSPYLPEPPEPQPDANGHFRCGRTLHTGPYLPRWLARRNWTLTDPATWRDLLWLTLNPLVTVAVTLTPLAMAVLGVVGVALPGVLNTAFGVQDPNSFWADIALALPGGPAVLGSAWLSVPVGGLLVLLALGVVPYALRAQARFTRLLLRPTKRSLLVERVERLTETRADATGVQAAELRRIERDLHDGAQARLVAIGMMLRAIERKLGPQQAEVQALVTGARETSAAALADLRNLVRGIHPPVLAERGLADAVLALALDSPLAVQVDADLPGRAEPPVEACAYFAVSEALANAAKHSGADQVRVGLHHTGDRLRITVSDNGCGGADPAQGSGLHGIRRRLGTFDGTLALASPPGGPTTLTMELPCVLSSPRTSTS